MKKIDEETREMVIAAVIISAFVILVISTDSLFGKSNTIPATQDIQSIKRELKRIKKQIEYLEKP